MVAAVEQDGVAVAADEQVVAVVAAKETPAAVVVVPCLAHHLQRHDYACGEAYICGYTLKTAVCVVEKTAVDFKQHPRQAYHAESYPGGVGIERTDKRVVAFAALSRGLVEIQHDGYSCHEPQQENHPSLAFAFAPAARLPSQAYQSEQQRNAVVEVVTLVVGAEFCRQQPLVAEPQIVDNGHSRQPVALGHLAVAVDVVLASDEVEHHIAPVHLAELIDGKVFDVVPIRRHLHFDGLHRVAVLHVGIDFGRRDAAHPAAVFVGARRGVDARTEHVDFRSVLCFPYRRNLDITVWFRRVGFYLLLIAVFLDFRYCPAVLVALHKVGRRSVDRAVEQWRRAKLVAGDVGFKVERVVRTVHVHRRVGIGANGHDGVARESYHDGDNVERDVVHHAHREGGAIEEEINHGYHKHCGWHVEIFSGNHKHARHSHKQQE